ncbi:hypothetical protein Nepgr_003328 [Nepenthes gracilis]|uniref:Secreted protein n=1 Tax=Nepenthes gracilis TaxID=150966 RepID=A0AAD3RZE7_NEPGR|nr:hypothetical protein Nepgr_003328 [Nepenthes gracilis]
MGFIATTSTKFFTFLFSIMLLLSVAALPSWPREAQAEAPSTSPMPTKYRSAYFKNARPYALDDKQADRNKKLRKGNAIIKNTRRKKQETMKRRTRSEAKNNGLDARTFSVMLPKGFIPPSGSSPCHNDYPTSVFFYCDDHFSTRKP